MACHKVNDYRPAEVCTGSRACAASDSHGDKSAFYGDKNVSSPSKKMMTRSSRRVFLLMTATPLRPAAPDELWQTLPPTPAPVSGGSANFADVNRIRLFHAEIGVGPPVVLPHGGLANSDYFGNEARALAQACRVILGDSRGHVRSTRDQRPFGYDLMADDVGALLDTLKIDKLASLGRSDGAIIGLDLAMRASREYAQLSATPEQYAAFRDQFGKIWEHEPNWTDTQLRKIRTPVWIVDGEHDEGIKREHTEHIAATIPGAPLLILADVSHFRIPAGSYHIQRRAVELPRRAAAVGINAAGSASLSGSDTFYPTTEFGPTAAPRSAVALNDQQLERRNFKIYRLKIDEGADDAARPQPCRIDRPDPPEKAVRTAADRHPGR